MGVKCVCTQGRKRENNLLVLATAEARRLIPTSSLIVYFDASCLLSPGFWRFSSFSLSLALSGYINSRVHTELRSCDSCTFVVIIFLLLLSWLCTPLLTRDWFSIIFFIKYFFHIFEKFSEIFSSNTKYLSKKWLKSTIEKFLVNEWKYNVKLSLWLF